MANCFLVTLNEIIPFKYRILANGYVYEINP